MILCGKVVNQLLVKSNHSNFVSFNTPVGKVFHHCHSINFTLLHQFSSIIGTVGSPSSDALAFNHR